MNTVEKIEELRRHRFSPPSAYEQKHVRWVSIGYDKEVLREFIDALLDLGDVVRDMEDSLVIDAGSEIQQLKESAKKEFEDMLSILEDLDMEFALALLSNEPEAMRHAMIEKWARQAALEILIDGKYSKETLNTVTQFPLADYKLVLKRSHEMVNLIQDVTAQATSLVSGVPGV